MFVKNLLGRRLFRKDKQVSISLLLIYRRAPANEELTLALIGLQGKERIKTIKEANVTSKQKYLRRNKKEWEIFLEGLVVWR